MWIYHRWLRMAWIFKKGTNKEVLKQMNKDQQTVVHKNLGWFCHLMCRNGHQLLVQQFMSVHLAAK